MAMAGRQGVGELGVRCEGGVRCGRVARVVCVCGGESSSPTEGVEKARRGRETWLRALKQNPHTPKNKTLKQN